MRLSARRTARDWAERALLSEAPSAKEDSRRSDRLFHGFLPSGVFLHRVRVTDALNDPLPVILSPPDITSMQLFYEVRHKLCVHAVVVIDQLCKQRYGIRHVDPRGRPHRA